MNINKICKENEYSIYFIITLFLTYPRKLIVSFVYKIDIYILGI